MYISVIHITETKSVGIDTGQVENCHVCFQVMTPQTVTQMHRTDFCIRHLTHTDTNCAAQINGCLHTHTNFCHVHSNMCDL